MSPPSTTRSRYRLSPQRSWTRAGLARMSRGASTTAGSTSNSTMTELARSSASPRVGATQAAIASPTYRTLSVASGGQAGDLAPAAWVTTRIGLTCGRSAAAKTRPAASGGTVIDLIRACACGLRRKATSTVPGNLMSETNSPRPCRCRSSSRRSSEAPTPQLSFGIDRSTLQHGRRIRDGGDDIGIAGAAADVAGEAVADLALRAGTASADQVARGDQHRRRAEAALQPMALMKTAAQRFHHRVAGEAFDRAHRTLVAGHRQHQARARRRAVDKDRASAAHAVLAAEMSSRQVAALAQKIG